MPEVDSDVLQSLYARAQQLFDEACADMQPGRSWVECDEWVRRMWVCTAAEEAGIACTPLHTR